MARSSVGRPPPAAVRS